MVVTDHKPLVSIVGNPQSKTTARLERICLKLQSYKLKVVYEPGNTNVADYLSRHPGPNRGHSDDHMSWVDLQTEKVCIGAVYSMSIRNHV